MKTALMLSLTLLNAASAIAYDRTVYVDAVENNLNYGTEMHVADLDVGVLYKLTITGGTATFNLGNYGEYISVGFMYVEPPRKMRMSYVEIGKPTYVVTEGNLYFFFADSILAGNSGGFQVRIQSVPHDATELTNSKGISGLFYDPNNSGHGFDINKHKEALVVFYYGHTASGERLWLISESSQEQMAFDQVLKLEMYEITNGNFGFPGGGATPWGDLYLEFSDCNTAEALLSGFDGTIEVPLTRLTGLEGIDCEALE